MRIEFVTMDDSSAQRIIQYLKWFNITNVSQLFQAIVKYTDAAIAIASEKLKTFKPDDNTTINTTISLQNLLLFPSVWHNFLNLEI